MGTLKNSLNSRGLFRSTAGRNTLDRFINRVSAQNSRIDKPSPVWHAAFIQFENTKLKLQLCLLLSIRNAVRQFSSYFLTAQQRLQNLQRINKRSLTRSILTINSKNICFGRKNIFTIIAGETNFSGFHVSEISDSSPLNPNNRHFAHRYHLRF